MKQKVIDEKFPTTEKKLNAIIDFLDCATDQLDDLDKHLSMIKLVLIAVLVLLFINVFFQVWTLLGF